MYTRRNKMKGSGVEGGEKQNQNNKSEEGRGKV